MKRYPAHLPASHPDRLAADESIDEFIGEHSVRIRDNYTPADKAAIIDGTISHVELLQAIQDNIGALRGCPIWLMFQHERDWDHGSTGMLLDFLDQYYDTLPADVRTAYDVILIDIDRAAMDDADRQIQSWMED